MHANIMDNKLYIRRALEHYKIRTGKNLKSYELGRLLFPEVANPSAKMSQLMAGNTKITKGLVLQLSEILGCSIESLFKK